MFDRIKNDRVHTFAVVMATGGVVLGSLWVVATAVVVASRTIEAAQRRELEASVPFRLDVVGLSATDVAGFRRALDRAATRGQR